MKIIPALVMSVCLLLSPLWMDAQSKKAIIKNKIKSITETVILYENGKEVTYKESYVVYDKGGKILEDVTYLKDGSIKKKETFKYDNDKNKIEETIFKKEDPDRLVNKKYTYKYNANNDKTEQTEYDGNGTIIKKEVYTYNLNEEKTSEQHYDGMGKLKKKINYTYDAKGLKIKKEIYNEENKLESVKKYTYEFY